MYIALKWSEKILQQISMFWTKKMKQTQLVVLTTCKETQEVIATDNATDWKLHNNEASHIVHIIKK